MSFFFLTCICLLGSQAKQSCTTKGLQCNCKDGTLLLMEEPEIQKLKYLPIPILLSFQCWNCWIGDKLMVLPGISDIRRSIKLPLPALTNTSLVLTLLVLGSANSPNRADLPLAKSSTVFPFATLTPMSFSR